MEAGYVERLRTGVQRIVNGVMAAEINYVLELDGVSLGEGFGRYHFGSLSDGMPRLSLNTAFFDALLDEGAIRDEDLDRVVMDTILSQYGALLYEVMKTSDSSLAERAKGYLAKRFKKAEGWDLESARLLDAGLEDFDIINFFAKAFSRYVRAESVNGVYQGLLEGEEPLDGEFAEFFGILFHGLNVLVANRIESNPGLVSRNRQGITFERKQQDEETSILIARDGEKVGRASFLRVPAEIFISDEITTYIEESELPADERSLYEAMEEGLSPAREIYHLTYLGIEQGFRGEKLGLKLMSEVMSLIKEDMTDADMVVLNASPMLGAGTLGAGALISFYEKFGFSADVRQGDSRRSPSGSRQTVNAMMSIKDRADIVIPNGVVSRASKRGLGPS